jgi:phosphopantothenoylcysteine decarboxylase/phosphopantothenate--cysteine ligase
MIQPLRVLVLCGPTREYLDPVRYISNASSGKQGMAVVRETVRRGHRVDLILGPVDERPPLGVSAHRVTSAREMYDTAKSRHPFCDVLIAAAAVSDFRPREYSVVKRKRDGGPWRLDLEPTEDILQALGREKGLRVHAGFALETEDPLQNALRKLLTKKLDWIVANGPEAIGAEMGEYHLLGADSSHAYLGKLSKTELAAKLLDAVERTAATRCYRR